MTNHPVVIFTDGAARGNPGPGGFAAIIIMPQNRKFQVPSSKFQVFELGGREEHTTNNRMELCAAIDAISFLSSLRIKDKGLKISVYTDSAYLLNGITRWIHGWQKNGWKTAGKKEVENRDLWEKLIAVAEGKKIEWKKIDGHSGIAGNERCDEIATEFADNKKPRLYSGVLDLPAGEAGNYPMKNILDVPRGLTSNRGRGQTSTERKRSRAQPYSYVSMVDGVIQTHKTWAECEKRVKGVRSAKYQKVFSEDEERALIKNWHY